MKKVIRNELELKRWFEKNFKKLGFSKIIRRDVGVFPDFIMLKGNKKVRVELETKSSNFILHNHNPEKVDKVVCVKKDVNLDIPVIEIRELQYVPQTARISATVEEETIDALESILKEGNFRNKSHVIETALLLLKEKEKDKNEK